MTLFIFVQFESETPVLTSTVEMSPALLEELRLSPESRPRSLEQWHELCHPSDHAATQELNDALLGSARTELSLTRRLYCGDGDYRAFRLDAFIQRDERGKPRFLVGAETPVPLDGASRESDRRQKLQETALRLREARDRLKGLAGQPAEKEEGPAESTQRERIIGVMGLTSSGKSTFVNAMMGERLLPEETRATTHVTVLCRQGHERGAAAFYQDGRVERAAALTPQWMEERASERGNPRNERGVDHIEWSSPSALIPPGVVLADTPGADAEGLHGELIHLLPKLDVILYLTPIRARFKGADRALIEALLEAVPDARMAFLLSQIDLERDDIEAGRVVLSREQKLRRGMEELRSSLERDFARCRALEGCPVLPISSLWALEGAASRGELWRASNFDAVLHLFSQALRGGPLDSPDALPPLPSDSPGATGKAVKTFFQPLFRSMREQGLRSRFLSLSPNGRFLLLGTREEGVRLLSRLLHDASLEETLTGGKGDTDRWLFLGRGEPPFPCESLPVPEEGWPHGAELLMAPSDRDLTEKYPWGELFTRWTPVVHVDLARVDSGLSDLSQAPYAPALAFSGRPWVLYFAHGGLFDSRLEDLALDVPERVNALTGGRQGWLICENYDLRYTDFLKRAQAVKPDTVDEEIAALADWGLEYDPPFTREGLVSALKRVRDRIQPQRR